MTLKTNPHEQAFTMWREHTSSTRLETDFFTQELLCKAYPNHHVTRTSPLVCDLLGYAKAGLATASQATEDCRDATRVYRTPLSRMDGQAGRLEDVVNFGRWDYKWNNTIFVVYELSYIDRFARIAKVLYILAPPEEEHVEGESHPKTDKLLYQSGEWTSAAHQQIWVFDNAQWTKNKNLWASVHESSWDDVIVQPAVRKKLNEDVHGFFDSRHLYQKFKIPWKRGIIFHGVPGVGKTLFIKIIIKSLADRSTPIPTLYAKSLDACAGPKWSIQQIFKKARRAAPCLLVLEDLDSLVGDHTRSYFLNEVDGLSSNDGILMIGSTNHLDRLDPAVSKRPSRFDRKYHFSLPTEDERLAYCRYWRQKFIDSEEVDFPDELCAVISKFTVGFSFAYLKELFVCSLFVLVQNNADDSEPSETREASNNEGKEAKQALPEVEVPLSVQHNQLLKTVKLQAQELLEDMDNGASVVDSHSSPSRPPPIYPRMQSLLDDPDE